MLPQSPSLQSAPNLVVADEQGTLFDVPELAMAGSAGGLLAVPSGEELIALPLGSDLFHLPSRRPLGIDRKSGEPVLLEQYGGKTVLGASAVLAPAHTLLLHPAYQTQPGAPKLPLYAYCAVGWAENGFVVPAVRVDPDVRQDHDRYTAEEVERCGREMIERYPHNRLAQHLMHNCLFTYGCPAARNFALGRWEMPLPTAPGCNSRCLGCISLQPPDRFPSSQQRIDFVPTVEEIVEIALPHLESAERPVASFGQGCEGEPLTNPPLLEKAVQRIREATSQGTLNLNTNGSRPEAVERLFDAGLDSIRVSINSCQLEWYNRYFDPQGYTFEDVIESLHVCRRRGRFASINYLVFPGISDTYEELEALFRVLESTRIDMIQWRNLNLDPEEYLRLLEPDPDSPPFGLKAMMQRVRERFSKIRFGYFNPCLADETR